MMKNFIIRCISGLFGAAILVGGVLLNETSCFVVLALVGILSLYEFLKNSKISKEGIMVGYGTFTGAAIAAVVFTAYHYGEFNYLMFISPILGLRFCIELFRDKKAPFNNISYEVIGITYTLLPMLLLATIKGEYIIALLVMVWANDIGAYIIGVTMGKHKLCERLSPKKSWEGFWGGIATAIIISIAISYIFKDNMVYWIIAGVTTALAAVAGDLFESMFKRSVGVKDSGNMIPGHGGMLDRFDATLFAAPLFYILYTLLLK